jgi:ribonuclease-3
MTVSVLGYIFRQPELAQAALRHPSLSARREGVATYERLEFLGDRVLGLVIAELLYTTFAQEAEGPLTRRHSALVRAESLADVARQTGLTEQLQLAVNDGAHGGIANDNILADAFEALLGAIYLDGGMEAAAPLIRRIFEPRVHAEPVAPRDAKTMLQEWTQARGPDLPKYEVLAQSGPPHAPVFEVQVSVPGGKTAKGQGNSKQQAQQAAAAALLELVEKRHG